ncbi:hypothetical protein [Gordonia caeni]|uniref:Lipoprotein n=1 Tax=Gordonia caeni TaxID=1007097 RepID=A0ABP7PIM4_9ACTN
MKSKWAIAALAVLALALSGCAGEKHEAPETGVVVTEIETATASTSAPESVPAETPVPTEAPVQTIPTQTVQPQAPPAGPVLGARCLGADAGKTAVDPNGVAIMCDEYRWRENIGQDPRHSWADDQAKWNECRQTNTMEQCRKMLNP